MASSWTDTLTSLLDLDEDGLSACVAGEKENPHARPLEDMRPGVGAGWTLEVGVHQRPVDLTCVSSVMESQGAFSVVRMPALTAAAIFFSSGMV